MFSSTELRSLRELAEWAGKSIEELASMPKHELYGVLISLKRHLRESGYSKNTIASHMSALRRAFRKLGVELPVFRLDSIILKLDRGSEQLVSDWLNGLRISEDTKKHYKFSLVHFLQWAEVTAGELIGMGNDAYELLIKYRKHLLEKHTRETVIGYVCAVKSFLRAYGVRPAPQDYQQEAIVSIDELRGIYGKDLAELFSFPSVRRWLSKFIDSPRTVDSYLIAMRHFMNSSGMDPDELIIVARTNVIVAAGKLNDFYSYLLAKGIATSTALHYYNAIRSFLLWNDITNLPRTPRAISRRTEAVYEPRRVLTQGEVAKLVGATTNIRDKALIAFLAQSGQRRAVVTALKYGHVKEDLEKGRFPIIVEVPARLMDVRGRIVNKIRRPYRFAVGYDACVLIKEMIEQRKRDGEEITEESWLFRSYASPRGGKMPIRMRKNEPGPPLSSSTIVKIVNNVAKRAGLQRKVSKISEIHPHIFRRYFNLKLQEAGIDPVLRDFLLGHKLPYEGAYDKYTADYIRCEWLVHRVDELISLHLSTEYDEIRRLVEAAKTMRIDLEELFAGVRTDNTDELVRELGARLLEQIRRKLTCFGGMPAFQKQRIISEEEGS